MGLCPALLLKLVGIDRVFRFFWQNRPLPCPIFKMGWNRLSFLFFKLKWTKEIEKIVPKWNRLSFLCLEWAKKWECRKNKIEKYIISKSLDKQKIKPHNKETIKTNTKCLRRQFTHHTGITWQLVNILCVSQLIAVSLVHPVQQVKRVYNLCISLLMAVCTQKVCCLVTSR